MTKVNIEEIDEVRERTIDAQSMEDWKNSAKLNLFMVERLWNEVKKMRRDGFEEVLLQSAWEAKEMSTMNNDLDLLKYKLKTLLKDSILQVSFTKADGTLREMKCTLKSTLVPDSAFLSADERERTHTVPENVLPVWDIEKSAWRSFRIDRVHDYVVTRKE